MQVRSNCSTESILLLLVFASNKFKHQSVKCVEVWHHKRRQTQSLKRILGTKPQKQIYQLIHMIVMKKCVCIQRAEVIIISSSNHEMGQKNRLFSLKLHALHKLYRLNPPFFSLSFPTAVRLRLFSMTSIFCYVMSRDSSI